MGRRDLWSGNFGSCGTLRFLYHLCVYNQVQGIGVTLASVHAAIYRLQAIQDQNYFKRSPNKTNARSVLPVVVVYVLVGTVHSFSNYRFQSWKSIPWLGELEGLRSTKTQASSPSVRKLPKTPEVMSGTPHFVSSAFLCPLSALQDSFEFSRLDS